MTKEFCDRCGFEIAAVAARQGKSSPIRHEITPGYVGNKVLCESCYTMWVDVVIRFFQNQGQ